MRFIKNIPHKVLGISLYSINRKYLVKFEKSDFEIAFKISEEEVLSLEELEAKILNPDFLNKINQELIQIHSHMIQFILD